MTVALSSARYSEKDGRDSLSRASMWQGNAGNIYGLNCVYTLGGVATATVTSKAKIVNTLQYAIGGKLFSKGATDNFWALGTTESATTVAVASWQKYLLCIDDAGAATVVEGTQSAVSAAGVTWGNVAAAAKAFPQNLWAPIITVLSGSRCIAAVLTIATDATHTFIPGTTLFGATGITATFNDGIDPSLLPNLANESGLLIGQKI